jgi:hypothetical protein
MKPKLINLTPHVITIQTGGRTIEIEPNYPMARVDVSTQEIGHIDGIPLLIPTYGDTFGLPAPEPGVFLIVSNIVLAAHKTRYDLLTPSRPIRDGKGQVVACGGLSVVGPNSHGPPVVGTSEHARAIHIMQAENTASPH